MEDQASRETERGGETKNGTGTETEYATGTGTETGLKLKLKLGGCAALRSQTKQRPIISPSFDLAQRPLSTRPVSLPPTLFLSLSGRLNY